MENMKMECPLKFSKSNRVLIRPVSAMEFSNGLYSIYIGIDAQVLDNRGINYSDRRA